LNRLSVSLQFSPKLVIPVGRLALDNRRIFFEYDKQFLGKDFWLSPYKLPLQTEVFEYKDDNHFGPIFGVFETDLPDNFEHWIIKFSDDIDLPKPVAGHTVNTKHYIQNTIH